MSSSTNSGVSTNDEYQNQRDKVILQFKNNQLEAVDLYTLASLLASWKSNASLPVCLLCQKEKPGKNGFGLGHLIPHSILKESALKSFVHLSQGKESGLSNMGYRAFCSGCEQRFSGQGEVNFNPKLFEPFHENQNDPIEVNVCDNDGNPWLYFCLISIVWRCLCFVPSCQIYIEMLEYLRSFLLNYPNLDPQCRDIDSKVKFYVFAPNSELESECKGDNEAYKRYFDQLYTARFECDDPGIVMFAAAWVYMGPIHILMTWCKVNGGRGRPFDISREDLDEAEEELCVFKRTDKTICIKNKQKRFFPMSVYPDIVKWGNGVISKTLRIPSKDNVTLEPLVIQATNLPLLPKAVQYVTGCFKLPDQFKKTFCYTEEYFTIVGARRGEREQIVFVCFQEAIKHSSPDGKPVHGPLAMALNVDDNGKLSYLKDVNIPSKEKCNGQDLNQIPYKVHIEAIIDALKKDGTAKW